MKTTSINELVDMATSMGIEDVGRLKKQDIIFRIVKQKASEGEDVFGGGVLEILNDGMIVPEFPTYHVFQVLSHLRKLAS